MNGWTIGRGLLMGPGVKKVDNLPLVPSFGCPYNTSDSQYVFGKNLNKNSFSLVEILFTLSIRVLYFAWFTLKSSCLRDEPRIV